MDFRDEVRVGKHTYGVNAMSQSADDDQPASVAVEFTGADQDGTVVAEGNLLVAVGGLADTAAFLGRTLEGLATLHGKPKRAPRGRSARAPNAGQPWTEQENQRLRTTWMHNGSGASSGGELTGDLAAELGRTRSAIRAQLARLECDPDVPGRALVLGATPDPALDDGHATPGGSSSAGGHATDGEPTAAGGRSAVGIPSVPAPSVPAPSGTGSGSPSPAARAGTSVSDTATPATADAASVPVTAPDT
ncbi:hypothetical protein HUO13_10195 [Saccharopolyspora erythraea]|uniref:hypothetical protein n=1 Tax=Saccharopolyspora erythraea TaxID=1836 RepID=UPI001BAA03F6|nr:hypothetical protein [Saccharopolyspora erythraea]QUH01132.1 hypothetical protein HUO13_10195 [Saccharopolyspora erythraea]